MRRFKKAMLLGGNKVNYTQIVQQTAPANLLAYWPMAETSGSIALDASGNGRNGAYTGVTLGAGGIGDGQTSASFDGTTSFNNIYSTSLNAVFNGQELTLSVWARVSAAGAWTDATARRIFKLRVDGNNYVEMYKSNTNNLLEIDYLAGGTVKAVTSTLLGGVTAWFHMAVTITKSGDALKFYLNGAQIGATQTGLGTYVGVLGSTLCCVGAGGTTPVNVWSGLLAHAAVWNTPLSAAQIAVLATVV